MNAEGIELEYVYSIIIKVGDGSAQFDVDGRLENLNNIVQVELADLSRPKYSPWTVTNVKSKNQRLNQILGLLMCYLTQSTRSTTTAMPTDIPPMAASIVTALESEAQASNSRSIARPLGRSSPRVRSCLGSN